jgi:hypothetical protein
MIREEEEARSVVMDGRRRCEREGAASETGPEPRDRGRSGYGTPRARRARAPDGLRRSRPRARAAARPREGSGRAREAQARKAPGSRDAGRATRGTCDASDTRRRETPRSIAIARGRGNRYAPMVLTRRCAGQKGEAGDGRGHILGFARSCSSQFYETES